MQHVAQLLDYLATNPEAITRCYALDILLIIHSDGSHLSESKSRSRLAGYYFMGSEPRKGEAIKATNSIYVATGMLRIVVCSAAEVELETLFFNLKEGKVLRLIFNEM